jgi:hypothetical protein
MMRRTDLQDHVTQQLQTVITEMLSQLLNSEDVDSSLIYNNLVKCGFVSVTPHFVRY